jgi:hypothetical protein
MYILCTTLPLSCIIKPHWSLFSYAEIGAADFATGMWYVQEKGYFTYVDLENPTVTMVTSIEISKLFFSYFVFWDTENVSFMMYRRYIHCSLIMYMHTSFLDLLGSCVTAKDANFGWVPRSWHLGKRMPRLHRNNPVANHDLGKSNIVSVCFCLFKKGQLPTN